jgi:amino acid adenylation domain-containing protein
MVEHGLHGLLDRSAARYPERPAVEEAATGHVISYRELAELSNRLRDRLHHLGVRPGDRVGLYLRKSIDAVVAIFGILKAGAAYVPVDPGAPMSRNAYILNDCAVTIVIAERRFEAPLRAELARSGGRPRLLLLQGVEGGVPMQEALRREDEAAAAPAAETIASSADDLAYVLYTSGSTGRPKGVMLSQRNAMSFVEWCADTFAPQPEDRFSSHAPFHFDLSIFDLYVPLQHGATVVLIGEETGKEPVGLAALIAERGLSVWYSAPSILSLLAQYGKLDRYDYTSLRLVLFAGEVFPVKHLRTLKTLLPQPRYFNLYGPTETNVCTFYEIPARIPEERTQPFPIGRACAHLRTQVVDPEGQAVRPGDEGELCVSGPAVMQGYWNLSEHNARAFLDDPSGQRWYRTGDVVAEDADGNYLFWGRRDRMVKRRGYRVELGEIEATLYRHPVIQEAAVIALRDESEEVRIKAFLSCEGAKRPSLIELKRFCAENLPLYMVPDGFSFQASLPKTSTDKIDYERLRALE